ncbi:MAG: DUF4476 domain-containing protein [Bacteroidetes bacterium]|nr:MAG: DUF4476 domain-containing protein [Bacteroidota bacterium]
MQKMRFLRPAWLILVVTIGLNLKAFAQRDFFVYLQAENQQPFYVSINKTIVNSSTSGYVILSKLLDTSYTIRVGFAGVAAQLEFDVVLDGADKGYLIKDFGEKGWGLFNLQNMKVQMAGEARQQRELAKVKAAEEAALRIKQQQATDSIAAATAQALKQQQAIDSIAAANAQALKAQQTADSIAADLALKRKEKQAAEQALVAIAERNARSLVDSASAPKLDTLGQTTTAQIGNQSEPGTKLDSSNAGFKNDDLSFKNKSLSVSPSDTALDSVKSLAAKDLGALPKDTTVGIEQIGAAERSSVLKKADTLQLSKSIIVDTAINPISGDSAQVSLAKGTDKFEIARVGNDSTLAQVRKDTAVSSTAPPQSGISAVDSAKFVDGVLIKTVGVSTADSIFIRDGSKELPLAKDTLFSSSPAAATQAILDSVAKPRLGADGSGKASPTGNVKFLDIELGADSSTSTPLSSAPPAAVSAKAPDAKTVGSAITANNAFTKVMNGPADSVNNTPCKVVADEKDFFNLRKKMVAEDNDADAMIMAAKKAFKLKCYTTSQMGNLAVLFLTDADKYAFLDAAYPFAYDRSQFAELGNMLNDVYYRNRFKAMLLPAP